MIFLVICQPLFYTSIICISYVIHIFREAWSRRIYKIKGERGNFFMALQKVKGGEGEREGGGRLYQE